MADLTLSFWIAHYFSLIFSVVQLNLEESYGLEQAAIGRVAKIGQLYKEQRNDSFTKSIESQDTPNEDVIFESLNTNKAKFTALGISADFKLVYWGDL